MSDITFALEAKSDQLNAVDIIGCDRVIKITSVNVTQTDQPVSIFFEGDHGRPWKPSKGMLRILAGCWGADSSAWKGQSAQLYFEPSVVYGGKAVGGIRVRAVTGINTQKTFSIAINRTKREQVQIGILQESESLYPDELFTKALPTMIKKMNNGEMSLQQVISRCQQTGKLSELQIQQLEQNAPQLVDDNC